MDLKITQERERITKTYWELRYDYVGHNGNSWYGFPCDSEGNLEPLNPVAQESLERCKANPDKYEPAYVWEYQTSHLQHVEGICVCGRSVYCSDSLWNGCDCGRYYDYGGGEVNPPHSGPYETGEYLSDIYNGRDEDY